MDSATNITINIVEPGSDVPVPDTGLFTHGIGGTEASIIATVGIVIIIAIAAIILYLRKKKINLKPSKHTSIILNILAIITSIATFTGLTLNSIYSHTNAKEGDLTVAAEDTNLTIEVGNQPVFAVLPVQVTVEEATQAGYTLTAYTDNTDLVSTTNPNNKIPMVTVEGDELTTLQDNTWGLALDNEPTAKDNKVYKALSTDQTNPTLITDKDYEETPANDTTTIYYGFYITPDMPVGTYVGDGEVVYDAIPNLATVTFDANGLYYNNDESLTTNTIGYKPNVAEAPIELVTGEYLTPAPLNSDSSSSSSSIHYTFIGWSEDKDATEATYVDEEDILANLTLSKNESLTLYAVWHYNTVLSFNGNTSDGGEPIEDITIAAGETITLPQNTYTRTGSVFTNWNTVADPTEQDPGEDYEDQADFTAPTESADITLYAQWAYYTTITFSGNGADSGTMSPQEVVAGTPENLVPNAYIKTNHTFIGWNTVQNPTPDNPGTTYQDQAEFVASTTQHEDITLYAQWASTTISFNGNTSESGTMNPIIIPGGEQVTLPQNAYTKSHCSFTSWNTNSDGTGTRYPGEASYTASMDGIYSFTLYAQWQCESMINFNGNGADSGYMAGIMATGGQQTTLPQNTFTKEDYIFASWNTAADGTGESYSDQGTYIAPVSESKNITLYAQWMVPLPEDLTFTAGDHIDTLMVADSTQNWKPFYVTPTSTDKSIVFTAPAEGTKYIITVVPEPGYVLSSDSTNSSYVEDFSTGTLASDTLLTTTYVAGAEGDNITISAAQAGSDSTHPAYTNMQDLTAAQCPAYTDTVQGINVTDIRNNKSYTVAKFGNYCYMLSNIRVDGNTALTSTTSNVSSDYTLPADTGSGGWANDSCQPRMASINGEYYYNWPAATARTNSTSSTGGCSNDRDNSVGDICPVGWTLPTYTYNDITVATLWNSGANPGMLSTSGYFVTGSQYDVGGLGYWWSSTRSSDYGAYYLYFDGTSVRRYDYIKYNGESVRCMRSS